MASGTDNVKDEVCEQPALHCKFFVVRKKRYCRMTVKMGEDFCGEHRPIEESVNSSAPLLRVVCPYDPKHTCYVDHLNKHLKKCNAKPSRFCPPYIVTGINLPNKDDAKPKLLLSEVDDSTLVNLIKKIKLVAAEIVPGTSQLILEHPSLASELKKPENGQSARKHLLQTSSLLGHMEKSGLIAENTCYIELGAGKGQLSFWLGNTIQDHDKSMLLLIDRASNRHKYDKRKREQELNIVRLRADIADLCLNKIDGIDKYAHVVAVSKHLCGGATDLALRCLTIHCAETPAKKPNVTGIMMAFCCHHRCDWSTYTGKTYLASKGLTQDEFGIMCGIASWATCGSGRSRSWEPPDSEDAAPDDQMPLDKDRYSRLELDQDTRRNIGRLCKLIIDEGRLQYLKECGYDCDLIYYIDEVISPENLCIIARHKSSSDFVEQGGKLNFM